MTDHSPVSVRQAGTGWTARCACGEYWTRRHVEQAEESHTRHAAEMRLGWDVELAARIGQAVKALRESATPKLSAAKLAERTTRCGYQLTKAQISDLELGRKKTVTVAELVSLALALGVPPVQLLYPNLPNGEVEIWPGVNTASIEALKWFSGDIPARDIIVMPETEHSTNDLVRESRRFSSLRAALGKHMRDLAIEQLIPGSLLSKREVEQTFSTIRQEYDVLKAKLGKKGRPVEDA